jgi:tricorn protease
MLIRPKSAVAAAFMICLAGTVHAQIKKPMLLQHPSISVAKIVFAFAGDLWITGREGGTASRLTTGIGIESDPVFSPDGALIAFSGQYEGNTDIYTVPAAGGIPSRLTHHPENDSVVGWSPDGKRILFLSSRNNFSFVPRLSSVPVSGGFPEEIPLPTASEGSYSPDGKRLAYVPIFQFQKAWKRYQGGQTWPIWIIGLSDLKVEKVPRENSNDSNPMWIGDKVYFLSDRKGPVSLFVYDTATKTVKEALGNDGFDFKSASAGPGGIIIEQLGGLLFFDISSAKARSIDVSLDGDFPEVRPHFVQVGSRISAADISPNGARAVFETRGEILTVPAEKGDIRNLTRTTGAVERSPAWSPDGKSVAYFSDESGEYALHIIDQAGKGPAKKIGLGDPPSFFFRLDWSPDGKKIAYSDKRLNLWYVDIDQGIPVKVDTTYYFSPALSFNFGWSPDSRWLTYAKQLPSRMNAIFAYSLETGKASQITDGLSDARFPAFDKSGKYLFFTASTDVGFTPGWLDMSKLVRPVSRSAYIAVLRKDLPSPLAPESDEEKPKEPEKAEAKDAKKGSGIKDADKSAEEKDKAKAAEKTVIDFEGISQRILALPVPVKNYLALSTGKEGVLFLLEGLLVPGAIGSAAGGGQTLHKFDLAARKIDKFLENVDGFVISATGEKILYNQGPSWAIAATAGPVEPGKGTLRTAEMNVFVDPPVEWRQMFHEALRLERDFFYDAGLHGLNLAALEKRYEPFLASVVCRQDLNYLFEDLLGELTCGHVFVGGGDQPEVLPVRVGLLGADYTIENGRYRFARVYNGENWNPDLRAPLTQPGVNVVPGEYLLAANGKDIPATEEVYKYFVATDGKQVTLKVGPNPDGKGAREVTVIPVADEYRLRNLAWIEDNRRKVDALSGGRLAYIWIPDTAEDGFSSFNRYYFAQVGKEGAIIDERFNQGGFIADYIIDYMRRPLMGYFASRNGAEYVTPVGSIYGPKVMIINEYAGSGGDMMPWLFRAAGVGPLVGTRTWGGLVGRNNAAPLMDGGSIGAPQIGFWNPNGTWDVENHGVDPDVMVEMDPAAVKAGQDPQLEKAIQVALDLLAKNPMPKHKKPTYPVYKRSWEK